MTEPVVQITIRYSSNFDTKKKIVALRGWTGHRPAAAQTFLPSKPLTAHSSRTGISFRQLALCVHLSLAKVENSFPSLMECHSHFQSKADERERSGIPLGENRFCIAGFQGLAAMPCHSQLVGNVMRWLPASVFGSGAQAN